MVETPRLQPRPPIAQAPKRARPDQTEADRRFQTFLCEADINVRDPQIIFASYYVEAGRYAMMNARPFNLGASTNAAARATSLRTRQKCDLRYTGMSYDLLSYEPRCALSHEDGYIVVEFIPRTDRSKVHLRLALGANDVTTSAEQLLKTHREKAPGFGYISDMFGGAELFSACIPLRMLFNTTRERFERELGVYMECFSS